LALPQGDDRLLTVTEAADILGCAPRTPHRLALLKGASAGAAVPEPLRLPNMDRLTLRELRSIRLFPLACLQVILNP